MVFFSFHLEAGNAVQFFPSLSFLNPFNKLHIPTHGILDSFQPKNLPFSTTGGHVTLGDLLTSFNLGEIKALTIQIFFYIKSMQAGCYIFTTWEESVYITIVFK